jgi:SAM-dependent methyltransferase
VTRVDCNFAYGAPATQQVESSEDVYDLLAPYYDLGTGGFDEDIAVYLGFARRTAAPVLELGCGTGRLLLPLARAGLSVAGLDRSAAMLGYAQRRLCREGAVEARLVQGEMCCPPLDGRFGLVFVALDGFLHLTSRDQQLQALRSARRLLSRAGLLLLDLPAPAAPGWEDWSAGARPLVQAWSAVLGNGARITKLSSFVADASTQTHQVSETYERLDRDGSVRRQAVEYALRFVFPAEMELLLDAAGLELRGRYGDYDLSPFRAGSPRQICVAGAAPSRKRR